jgi:UMF1 family MFS transporter
VVAWIGSLVFAKLSKRYKTVPLILVCIAGYFAVCLYALTLKTLLHFGILAFGVGCFQGSIQSLSRSYYSKIIPPENSGEYFGIYDIFSKGASFLGSAVLAAVKLAGGTINIAVASLAVFFALGYLFLRISDKTLLLGDGMSDFGPTSAMITEENVERYFGVRACIADVRKDDETYQAFIVRSVVREK